MRLICCRDGLHTWDLFGSSLVTLTSTEEAEQLEAVLAVSSASGGGRGGTWRYSCQHDFAICHSQCPEKVATNC